MKIEFVLFDKNGNKVCSLGRKKPQFRAIKRMYGKGHVVYRYDIHPESKQRENPEKVMEV